MSATGSQVIGTLYSNVFDRGSNLTNYMTNNVVDVYQKKKLIDTKMIKEYL